MNDRRRAEVAAAVASLGPTTGRGQRARAGLLRYLAWLDAPFDENADPVHVTGSAIVLDGHGHTLLHRHRRLGLWLQPGGHLEPDEDPADGALRETIEETGLPARHPDDGPLLVDVDVHEGGRGHLHLDLRYLLLAPNDVAFDPATGESPDLRWVPVEDVDAWGDASVTDAVRAADLALRRRSRSGEVGTQ